VKNGWQLLQISRCSSFFVEWAFQVAPQAPRASTAGYPGQGGRRDGAAAETLRRLNPGYNGGKLIAGVPRLVLMPATDAAAPHVTTSGEDALADADDTPTAAPAVDEAPAPDGATRTHRVGEGESVWTIAKRYGVSVAQVLRLNNLGRKAVLRPGQVLKLTP